MAIEHDSITDPEIHEPKGISTASSNTVYVSDGAGSGTWIPEKYHINGYIPFDAVTPAYQHNVSTTFTALNPTFSATEIEGFSAGTTPNARLIYTGTEDTVAHCTFVCNFKNASGTARQLEAVFYRNGTAMNGGHIIVTAESGAWHSLTLTDMITLNTNDYIELFVKGDSAFTLDIASASLIVTSTPVAV
jgi:hypothetical protein